MSNDYDFVGRSLGKKIVAPLSLFLSLAYSVDVSSAESVIVKNAAVQAVNDRALAARANFDFDTSNGAIDFVVNSIPQEVFNEVSPGGGDASLVLRVTTLLTNAWFDASAPYHKTAVGVYSDLGRRPASESETNKNINIALIYASYHVLSSLMPAEKLVWRQMVVDANLDPDNTTDDLATPAGIGNVAGKAVVAARQNDGMNQLGNESDLKSTNHKRKHHSNSFGKDVNTSKRSSNADYWSDHSEDYWQGEDANVPSGSPKNSVAYNRASYRDYTGYMPRNTADYLANPSRWQPDIVRDGIGIYRSQRFVTPQYGLVTPYSYESAKDFRFPAPQMSQVQNRTDYVNQANNVLENSAGLTDERKLKSEFFDSKINSLIGSVLFASAKQELSLLENIHLQFTTSVATFDAGIVVWQEKKRFDAVRPFSAISYIYGNQNVTAWGGPGRGTVTDLPAKQWRSYLQTADHPEYPSASACFCYAHAQSATRYTGTDSLGLSVPFRKGQSNIEPGITPSAEMTLSWDSWTDFAKDCGQSRLWSGVHFQASIDASANSCRIFGDIAHDYVDGLIKGKKVSQGELTAKYQAKIEAIRY